MKTIIFLLLILSSLFGAAFAQSDEVGLGKPYIQMNVSLKTTKPDYYISYKTLKFTKSTTKHNVFNQLTDLDFIAKGSCIWSFFPLDHLLCVRFKIYQKTSNGDKPFCSVYVGARADSWWGKLTEPVKFQVFPGDTCHTKASYQIKKSGNTATLNITIPPQAQQEKTGNNNKAN